jgi:hypothetical protein
MVGAARRGSELSPRHLPLWFVTVFLLSRTHVAVAATAALVTKPATIRDQHHHQAPGGCIVKCTAAGLPAVLQRVWPAYDKGLGLGLYGSSTTLCPEVGTAPRHLAVILAPTLVGT